MQQFLQQDGQLSIQFVCTHNSRRSQMSQVLGQVLAERSSLPIKCYSGGTEVTAFNPRAVAALERLGLRFVKHGRENPCYFIWHSSSVAPQIAFSKLVDHPFNQQGSFIAVMTCNEADQNCPLVPGATSRFSLPYVDPKHSDNTDQEADTYDQTVRTIATEIWYLFALLRQGI